MKPDKVVLVCLTVLECISVVRGSGEATDKDDDEDHDADVIAVPAVNCEEKLRRGQYLCNYLAHIDPATQQLSGCNRDTGRARVSCQAAPGMVCLETGNSTFFRDFSCQWTNGYDFDTALLLSIFLGFFGLDRFYLGYPAIGVLKFCTLGFFFLGHLLDIILIASQVVQPADGSHYVISYFGPRLDIISFDPESTARRSQPDWF